MLVPGSTVAKIVLTTAAEALASAATKLLDIEDSDIGAEFRVAMTSGGRAGNQVEIYLYDLTPGGAGFVRSAAAEPQRLLKEAILILESCVCSHSCYECLRSYKNKWDHGYLDRTLGAAFLRHVVYGETPTLGSVDEHRLLRTLAVDLKESGHTVELVDGGLRLTNIGNRLIVLGHPLIPGAPGSRAGRTLVTGGTSYVVVDKLVVDRALPAAVRQATGALSRHDVDVDLPLFLPVTEAGLQVFDLKTIAETDRPVPIARVSVPGAPDGAFVVQLTSSTLDRGYKDLTTGSWVVFIPSRPDDFAESVRGAAPRLLLSIAAGFNATNERWTLGVPTLQTDKVKIHYMSPSAPRSETPRRDDVRVLGRAYGVFVDGVLCRLEGV
jgi:hypothetical protein